MSYDPSKGTTSNKSYAVTGKPDGFRTYYADPSTGLQRQFVDLTEVNNYFDSPAKRMGQFDIVVNTGGTLAFGVITGGVNDVYYYKDGQQNSDLVLKYPKKPVFIPYPAGSADPFFQAGLQTLTSINGIPVTTSSWGINLDIKVILATGSMQIEQKNMVPEFLIANGLPDTVAIQFGSGQNTTIDDFILIITSK